LDIGSSPAPRRTAEILPSFLGFINLLEGESLMVDEKVEILPPGFWSMAERPAP
jgi:hypothetical protein